MECTTITNQDLDETSNELTPIQSFYKDTLIFITGCSGFLGQLLLEKLLRSCPDIATIYILMREKKGKDIQTRLDEIFDNVMFHILKRENPKFRHKVVALTGDCALPNLGLSIEAREILVNKVNIVFHVAATVRFDEKLKLAVPINIGATRDLINIAKEMENLKLFIHVSTAFANCVSRVIEEKVYPPAIDYEKIITIVETVPEQILEQITPSLIGNYPNSYAFTKQIAEDVVLKLGTGLPIGIFRPSIVVSTYKEPIEGWINNIYGPTGIILGAGLGLLRITRCDGEVNANIIPADMVVNSLIAVGWEVANNFKTIENTNRDEVPVYNFENSTDSPLLWKDMVDLSNKHSWEVGSVKAVWCISFFVIKNVFLYNMCWFFLHTVPAAMVDSFLLLIGKSPKLLKAYTKIAKFCSVITYFSTNKWTFKSYNVRKVLNKMSDEDRRIFFSDLKKLNWRQYFPSYLRGVRVYLAEDPLETLEAGILRLKRFYWAHQTIKVVVIILAIRLTWFIFSLIF